MLTSSSSNSSSNPSVTSGDTIYVQYNRIQHFVQHFLPKLTMNETILTNNTNSSDSGSIRFVVISGSKSNDIQHQPLQKEYIHAILDHPNVLHWFGHNIPTYFRSNSYDFTLHPKLTPVPYGLKWHEESKHQEREEHVRNLKHYRKLFLDQYGCNDDGLTSNCRTHGSPADDYSFSEFPVYYEDSYPKATTTATGEKAFNIFISKINVKSNIANRKNVPSSNTTLFANGIL